MLQQAGIDEEPQLRELGAVVAFWQVKQHQPQASLNLLWALAGALSDRDWQQVAREDRLLLLSQLELLQEKKEQA